MKLFYSLFLLVFLVGCKKENTTTSAEKITIIPVSDILTSDLEKQSIDSSLLASVPDKTILPFYKSFNNETVWISKKNRKELLESLSNSDKEGLSPEDYPIKKLNDLENKINSLTKEQIVEYDLLLTQNFYKYISVLTNGKLNPRKLYSNWDLKPNTIELEKVLTTALKENKIGNAIEQSKPQHIVYSKLKNALVYIDKFPNKSFQNIVLKEKKLMLNDSSTALISIKERLIYWKDMKAPDSLTSIYDESTLKAVKAFQKRHGLDDDGVIGSGTITALNISKEKRKEQIIANLERWRWFPKNMGESYFIINIPDYTLHVIKEKDTIRSHKIIVGTAKRQTPVLSSKLNYIVYNPTWTVPPTILKEDLIPATSRNTNYLDSRNITVYDKNNNIVNAINWKAEDARGYRYVQSPGDYNSLGRVKIIFPNTFLVYLHDTNNRGLFNRANRAISSGCIRVESPMPLTEYILDDKTNWNQDKIDEIVAAKKTKNVNIKKDIQIHLLYWTAWMDTKTLEFREDIYKLDSALYKKLRE